MKHDPTVSSMDENRQYHHARSASRLAVIACAGVILVLCFGTQFSPAQTPMELIRWREFSYAKQTNEVGGRIAAIDGVHRTGLVMLGDGEFARLWSSTVHTTSPEGKEFYQGFVMYDFNDGSSILAKVDVSGERNSRQMGTIIFLAGTKRFKGISGRGTVYAWMPAKWDMYAEIEASYSVPETEDGL
jgi:hypothetical protein